jgi:hypothetical protein
LHPEVRGVVNIVSFEGNRRRFRARLDSIRVLVGSDLHDPSR